MKRLTVYKSSVTGRFVTKEFADDHPRETFKQTIMPWRWIQRMRAKRAERK